MDSDVPMLKESTKFPEKGRENEHANTGFSQKRLAFFFDRSARLPVTDWRGSGEGCLWGLAALLPRLVFALLPHQALLVSFPIRPSSPVRAHAGGGNRSTRRRNMRRRIIGMHGRAKLGSGGDVRTLRMVEADARPCNGMHRAKLGTCGDGEKLTRGGG
ncbi:unnamed protein product [Miscanthus lutarioriparius]|uniref:Uncharacterized protein n=1 Tax=Miscanthus lutarioriparius TaxID=422564 RepID=A0A811NR35_9POAL|nr:unnamed protein product [Miscanthus lutarioriparius]